MNRLPAALRTALALGLLVAAGAGCTFNPVTGRLEMAPISSEQEKEIDRDAAGRVAEGLGLVEAPILSAYLDAVSQRLAQQLPRLDFGYRIYLVDGAEPNAFTRPGGYVFVTSGLLALLNSEDELAGILGHEIGHVAARHSGQRVSRAAPIDMVSGLGPAVRAILSPRDAEGVAGFGRPTAEVVPTSFSQDQEREADRVGQALAAAAGWDPGALSSALTMLSRQDELSQGGRRRPGFLDSHPSTPERVASVTRYAAELQRAVRPIEPDRAAFLAQLDGLVVGESAHNGVFDGPRFLHPELDFSLRLPNGWTLAKRPEQVGAMAPEKDSLVTLEALTDGDDPLIGARVLEEATGIKVGDKTQLVMVGSLRSARTRFRARADSGNVVVELAWIAYKGRIFQLSGVAPLRRAATFQAIFTAVVESFRPLLGSEHAAIQETRLRIVEAREGETIDSLAARTQSRWPPAMVAVANGLTDNARLSRGQLLKIAVAERYEDQ